MIDAYGLARLLTEEFRRSYHGTLDTTVFELAALPAAEVAGHEHEGEVEALREVLARVATRLDTRSP